MTDTDDRTTRHRKRISSAAGFTFLELIIVMALVGIVALIGIPNLIKTVRQSRTVGFMSEFQNYLARARQEAIQRNVPVVIEQDVDNQRVFIFANVDGDPALAYNEDNTVPFRTADYIVATLDLPSAGARQFLYFHGPDDAAPEGPDMVDGFTLNGDGDLVAVFEPDGSIRNVGAFRVGDDAQRNYFELRIAPAATARVSLRKWYENPPFGPGVSAFFPRGFDEDSGKNLWKWY